VAFPNSVENPMTLYGLAPPDQQATDLRSLLDQARAIMARDGGLDDEEMAAASEFMNWIVAFAMQTQAGGGGAQRSPMGGPPEIAPQDALASRGGEPMERY